MMAFDITGLQNSVTADSVTIEHDDGAAANAAAGLQGRCFSIIADRREL
jgi:hypothetical protein